MEFRTFVFIIIGSFLTGFIWHWIIRSAVTGGIRDAANKAAKERAALKATRVKAERKTRPPKVIQSQRLGTDNDF